jgi:hypothetical protein
MTGTAATGLSTLTSAWTSNLARRHSNISQSGGPHHFSSRCVFATLLLR